MRERRLIADLLQRPGRRIWKRTILIISEGAKLYVDLLVYGVSNSATANTIRDTDKNYRVLTAARFLPVWGNKIFI